MASQVNAKPLVDPPNAAGTTSVGTSQVPIWRVPFPRNGFFTGREEVLTQLHDQLKNTSTAALSQPLAMSGLGGIGKTQTAVEYAYRHREEYQVVCWVKSSTPEELAEDFASIARLLHLPEQYAQEQALIITTVKSWFETHFGWLLIFDNADDLATLSGYLPQSNTGHVLITTRAHAMSGIATKIELQTMNREEGTRLLLQRAGLLKPTTSLEQIAKADLNLAYRIIYELGGLPLAIDQAGAYLEESNASLEDYLILFEEQRAELLQRRGGVRFDHAPVATTWTLAFQTLEDSSPDAIELIRLYAFLAPDEIPEELLAKTAHLLNHPLKALATNQARFNEAISALLKYSLIQRDRTSKTLSIHRLVQAVIKDEISKTRQRQWTELIVRMFSHVFPFNEVAPWTRSQRHLPHALLAVEYISQWSFNSTEARHLLNALGIYFESRGQFGEAEPLLQRYRFITEQLFGPNDPRTMASVNNLAGLYVKQGKYKQAEPLYQRALTIREQRLGKDHPQTAGSLNNLAGLYVKQGEYEQAEPLIQRALTIREQRLGKDHPQTADSLNSLANLYTKQGQYEQAEPLFQRALSINEQCLGKDHPQTADSLNSLASLYTEQGQYEQAEPLIQHALSINEQRLGKDHPHIAFFLTTQANLYFKQGKYEQAEPLFQKALTIFEQKYGTNHLNTITCLNYFADLYSQTGKYEQAESFYHRIVAIFKQRLGENHPKTVQAHEHYSQLRQKMQTPN